MPRISEFYGLSIYMYHREHGPAHFHVIYGEYSASVGIELVMILNGTLPARARSMVFEWAAQHQPELRANWERALQLEPLERIQPLQ